MILTSSIASQIGLPGTSIYSACKAAVRSMATSFSAELLPRGIRVNSISPGLIETEFGSQMPKEDMDRFAASVAPKIPMGRMGKASEIATVAVFLASSDSSYIAGADLVVDGGWTQV